MKLFSSSSQKTSFSFAPGHSFKSTKQGGSVYPNKNVCASDIKSNLLIKILTGRISRLPIHTCSDSESDRLTAIFLAVKNSLLQS